MDYEVVLSPLSIEDLEEIVRYVSQGDPAAAERLGNSLIDSALELRMFPERGRLVPEFSDGITREIIHRPYRIVYRVDHRLKAVHISRFWHGARLLSLEEG
jgi:Plasmid stabilization system protein